MIDLIRIRMCELACVNSYPCRLDTTRLVSRVVGEPIAASRVVGEPIAQSRVVEEFLNDHIQIRISELACVNSYLPSLVLTAVIGTDYPPIYH